MTNKWTLYIEGAKKLRMEIDAADNSCLSDVGQLSAVPLQTLETMLTDKAVCIIIIIIIIKRLTLR